MSLETNGRHPSFDSLRNYPFLPDYRPAEEAALELKIQLRAKQKDPEFRPNGPWKELIREENGVSIYQVNSEWMRNNLLASWNHGGHGYVCEFIPVDEIWVGDTHPENCACQGVNEKREMSDRYFESCVLHETIERELMTEGMIYWNAHQIALEMEKKAGLIPDGYTEDYKSLPQKLD